MSFFDNAFEYTQEFEGGEIVTKDPHDSGGTTKYGIAQKFHPGVDVENLTEEAAKSIYRNEYWKAMNLDALKSERIAIKLFDAGVNIGTKKAIKLAQRAYNDCVSNASLVDDGILGKVTAQMLNEVDEDAFFLFFVNHLEDYYRSLNNPTYIKGWLRRARTLPQ